mgnify:CR=1 FL=1
MSAYPVKEFSQNKLIFSEGSRGETAYILKKGSVAISIKVDAKEKEVSRLFPPSVFGEMALLLKDHKRTATARALECCEAVEISREAFDAYVDQSPPVIANILGAFADRLLSTTKRSLRTPDLFLAVCEILHLLGANKSGELSYMQTVQSFSKAFVVSTVQIEALFEMMESAKLIEMKKEKGKGRKFFVADPDDFLPRADNVYNSLKNLE